MKQGKKWMDCTVGNLSLTQLTCNTSLVMAQRQDEIEEPGKKYEAINIADYQCTDIPMGH